jgi:MerR family copper efflux transcriptional regulator
MLSTGQMARKFKVSLQTLRHYENMGLLTPARIGGQRAYEDRDVRRLETILERKRSGLALAEIEVLLQEENGEPSQAAPKRAALRRV